jgi:hypothetical protein
MMSSARRFLSGVISRVAEGAGVVSVLLPLTRFALMYDEIQPSRIVNCDLGVYINSCITS